MRPVPLDARHRRTLVHNRSDVSDQRYEEVTGVRFVTRGAMPPLRVAQAKGCSSSNNGAPVDDSNLGDLVLLSSSMDGVVRQWAAPADGSPHWHVPLAVCDSPVEALEVVPVRGWTDPSGEWNGVPHRGGVRERAYWVGVSWNGPVDASGPLLAPTAGKGAKGGVGRGPRLRERGLSARTVACIPVGGGHMGVACGVGLSPDSAARTGVPSGA